MLSMASLGSSAQAGSYYTKDNYYTGDASLETSLWAGEGAVAAGLDGPVDVETFKAVLEGQMPDGSQIGAGGEAVHAPGFDLTFSAPKSVSLLALVGRDERIQVAFLESVQKALAHAEKNFAEARVWKDGKPEIVRTGKLVVAMFQHDTSRNLDPQLHIHSVVANATQTADGKWRALWNGKIWENNTLIGSIQNSYFREALAKLGYETVITGLHGQFEAEPRSITREIIEPFSTRRAEILEHNGKLDYQNRVTLLASALNTRPPKTVIEDREILYATWSDRALALGVNLVEIVQGATARLNAPEKPWDRIVAGLANAAERAGALVGHFRKVIGGTLGGDGSHRPGGARDPLEALPSGKMTPAASAAAAGVASAVRHLAERETSFDRLAIAKAALDLGLPVTIDDIDRQLNSLIRNGALVRGSGEEKDRLTTPGAIRKELLIIAHAEAGRGVVTPVIASPDRAGDKVQAAAQARGGYTLNAGQESAARLLLGSSDRIVAIQGVAGAGKSSVLGAVADVVRGEGHNIIALGVQNKLVQMLGNDAGIEAMTVARFLYVHGQLLDERSFDDRLAMARAMFKDAILVVDESSMLSNDQALKLAALANRLEVGRLAFVGDKRQLGAVEAGKPFEVLHASGTATALMTENLRARDPLILQASALANDGRPGLALDLLGQRITAVPQSKGAVADVAAARWLGLASEDRGRTLLMTSGRRLMGEVNAQVQAGLVADGTLRGQGLALTILDKATTSREQERSTRSYEPGMRIEFNRDVPGQGIARGTATITAVDHAKGTVTLDRDGKQQMFKPGKLQTNRDENAVRLGREREIRIHEGDRIRWTDNDRTRGLYNADTARVLGIGRGGVTIANATGVRVTLPHGDPMLSRLDLGYAMNTHQLQGATADRAIAVASASEANLANGRLFLVNITRARDSLEIIVDDPARYARAIERNPGDKTSALETLGELAQLSAALPITQGTSRGDAAAAGLSSRDSLLGEVRGSDAGADRAAAKEFVPQTMAPVPVKQLDLGL